MRTCTPRARVLFDLTQGPLFRVVVYRLTDSEHVLFVAMHHIVSDGWSFGLFMRELSGLYRAHVGHGRTQVSAPPIQYADYAYWQQAQWLKSDEAARQLAYWQEKLGFYVEPLQLPVDLASPPQRTQRGASRSYTLSSALTEKLKSLSRTENTTLFVTLLTAFKVLLNRQPVRRIDCGSPAVGRIRPRIVKSHFRYFNIVVLRSAPAGLCQNCWATFTKRLYVYDNQAIPFNMWPIGRSAPRSAGAFTLQDAVENVLDLPGIQASSLTIEQDAADFDLFLYVEQKTENLVLDLRYKNDP
ncbi:MAG: condensation domain-containing protein [Caldilineaceae bacterium]